MAFVVAVAQQKGGAGKSTVAANLAVALAAEGQRVALLDTDPQHSLGRWHEERLKQQRPLAGLGFETPSGWRLPAALDRLRRGTDWIILDTPPHAETDAKLAIRGADLVLVPIQPSPVDLWASEATLRLAADEKRRVVAMLNRVPAQGKLREMILASLVGRGVAVLGAGFGNRLPFASAFLEGLGVLEAAPKSPAAAEVRALAAAILALRGEQG